MERLLIFFASGAALGLILAAVLYLFGIADIYFSITEKSRMNLAPVSSWFYFSLLGSTVVAAVTFSPILALQVATAGQSASTPEKISDLEFLATNIPMGFIGIFLNRRSIARRHG